MPNQHDDGEPALVGDMPIDDDDMDMDDAIPGSESIGLDDQAVRFEDMNEAQEEK